jgi:beta-lactamase regulating signal transducer with metallopeptidase domain/tetratricopeptide (TPR) repeat protein
MISHLMQSTATALLAIGLVFVLRRQSAALRHTILLAAMLRFLVPTTWLAEAGGKLADCLPSRVMALPVVDDVSRLIRRPPVRAAPAESVSFTDAVEWLWAAGAVLSLGVWLRGQMRRIGEVRGANADEVQALGRVELNRASGRVSMGPARVRAPRLRIIAAGLSPGVLGPLRPTILVPDGLISELTEAEVDTVLAHELAHIERKDLWTAAAARIITCVFWFHPLLWWMERRMLKERETACDELVLARGANAHDYAGAIAKVCRMAWGGSQAYAGIADSDLKERMEHIMTSSLTVNTSGLLRASLGVIAGLAVLLPVAEGFIQAQPGAVSRTSADTLYEGCLDSLRVGQFKEAKEGFQRLHNMEPANSRSAVGMAVVSLLEGGHSDDAMQAVEAEMRSNPRMIRLGIAVGDYYVGHGKNSDAIEEYRRLLNNANNSEAAEIYAHLGEAYRRAGDLNQAIWMFRQAIQRNPQDSTSMARLGVLLEGAGQKEAAREEYLEVLKLDPRNAIALNNLAYIEGDGGGDLVRATEYALRAKELIPQSHDVADTVGWIYVKRQMADEAIAVLKDVVIADPGNIDFRKHLASAMDLKGLNSASMEELKKALRSEATRPETMVGAVKELQ